MKDVISLGLIACAAFASNVNASAHDALQTVDDVTFEVVMNHLHTDCRFQVEKTFDMEKLSTDQGLFDYDLALEQCVAKIVQTPNGVQNKMDEIKGFIKEQQERQDKWAREDAENKKLRDSAKKVHIMNVWGPEGSAQRQAQVKACEKDPTIAEMIKTVKELTVSGRTADGRVVSDEADELTNNCLAKNYGWVYVTRQ
ncbi:MULTISPECIES: hypothetical protein [Aeromonas]|uniref:hypothetical protein n=1 Tax=Aeromonas TaxID=642 RepID=UPI0005A735E0|nr:hypothetical protein [Aeromonas allosaccharophila]